LFGIDVHDAFPVRRDPRRISRNSLGSGKRRQLLGNTQQGGSTGAGVVFKITSSGKLTVLFSFDTTHGADPVGPLVQGSDGNLYGIAQKGGTKNSGVVFKITTTGVLTVLQLDSEILHCTSNENYSSVFKTNLFSTATQYPN
jgi:uncharacterized repeat protein (TIGR03803 family)